MSVLLMPMHSLLEAYAGEQAVKTPSQHPVGDVKQNGTPTCDPAGSVTGVYSTTTPPPTRPPGKRW